LRHSTTIGEGLGKTLRDLQRHIASFVLTFIIINDSKKEQVEDRATKKV
jgi:hypothetical protein